MRLDVTPSNFRARLEHPTAERVTALARGLTEGENDSHLEGLRADMKQLIKGAALAGRAGRQSERAVEAVAEGGSGRRGLRPPLAL